MLGSLVVTGAVGSVYSAILTGTSAERRAAIAKRAITSDLLVESQQSPKDFPCVPKDTNWKNSPGIRLAYRLPIAQLACMATCGHVVVLSDLERRGCRANGSSPESGGGLRGRPYLVRRVVDNVPRYGHDLCDRRCWHRFFLV